MISDAESNGGKILTGGTEHADVKEKFIPPTLILNPGKESKVLTEEIFGCVLPIVPYSTEAECVSFINSVNGISTPLALYVFTTNDEEFKRYMDKIPSGDAVQNDVLVHFACSTIPFGGMGTSGYGQAHGKYGFDAFTHTRGVLSKPCRQAFEFAGIRYPPYDKYGGWSGKVFKTLARVLPEIPVMHSKVIGRVLGTAAAAVAMAVIFKRTGVGKDVVDTAMGGVRMGLGIIGGTLEELGGWIKNAI